MYAPRFASHTPSVGSISLLDAPIVLSKEDFVGVHIAATTLADDFARVTRKTASRLIYRGSENLSVQHAIIVGSVVQSPLIQSLIRDGKLDCSSIEGQWECYTTKVVEEPLPGVRKALVIAGSDKRGTIYGVYTLSEQIGVSPWYWWADAPIRQAGNLYAHDIITKNGPPSVKYRGIFINDEAPSLSSWVHEKVGPRFNADFYKRVFELLLRLKANFLWPAMWFDYPHPGSSFFMDDVLNQETADRYGIVISTSHHEPMQRAMNEWFDAPYFEPEGSWSWLANKDKVTKYFQEGAQRAYGHESYITMGMRGHGDKPINADDPTVVVKDVLSTQRRIIKETYGKEDGVPQLMALYKEVQEYYDGGLQIPDDITLLFANDNFGTVRRLPSGNERTRKGGAGVYYHLEYVGTPRSYKWLNSNSCAKVWQQLKHTYDQGANQVWIFNVGDIKPLEVPITSVMSLAWNINILDIHQLPSFFHTFIERTLRLDDAISTRCSELLLKHDRLVALRKHEHIESDTFSLINYGEAEEILQRWKDLLDEAEEVRKLVPENTIPSYFQLILHPIKASYIYVALRVNQAKNQLYGLQRRNTANKLAHEALHLFDADFDLSEEYHSLLDGKWDHIMRQPHYGYTDTWHAPNRDMISGICFVQTRQDANPASGYIGVAVEGHGGVRPGLVNEESDRTHPTRRDKVKEVTLPPLEPFGPRTRLVEIYCRGSKAVAWTLTSPFEWLIPNPSSGTINPKGNDILVKVEVDWTNLPETFDNEVLLDLRSSLGDFEQIHVPVKKNYPPPESRGFVESDGHVSINATSFQHTPSSSYQILPYLGPTPTGAVSLCPGAPSTHQEYLEYPFITFTPTSSATLVLEFTLTLDTDPNTPITYDIQLDDGSVKMHRLIPQPATPGSLPEGWKESVTNCVWKRRHQMDLERVGQHVLRVRLGAQNCILDKIIVDLGGVRESYLGPPESRFYQKV
ncbi:hypothetical protein BJY04DRAFT_226232 [Aspergillus karnatakaensis]|uniref:uncharacterized protein n=1 Tax=Aspergillus karnatakaensis TaxID=1810916 RepID=UPI003CCD6996